jgi:hypothetical protein
MRLGTLLRNGLMGIVWAIPLAVVTACSPTTQPSDCPPPHPTFRLTVSCVDGPVPNDVTISVTYGGGVEEFDAKHPDDTPTSVFCSIQYESGSGADASTEQDASTTGGDIARIVCELWTDGRLPGYRAGPRCDERRVRTGHQRRRDGPGARRLRPSGHGAKSLDRVDPSRRAGATAPDDEPIEERGGMSASR